MKRSRFLMACGLVVLFTSLAAARIAAPPPPAFRMAASDVVVVGKVTKLEEKTLPADRFKGDTGQMKVAVVKVSDTLLGKPGKEIKVGFATPMGRVFPGSTLAANQEGILFLTRHPKVKDVYVLRSMFGIIEKSDDEGFKMAMTDLKKAGSLLADPMKGLKSTDANERLMATALLITRYRTERAGTKLTAIPSAESKLILNTLSEASWTATNPRMGYQTNPRMLFFQLGLTDKDGWKPDANNLEESAKKWLKANASAYRIKGYTSGTTTDPEPGK